MDGAAGASDNPHGLSKEEWIFYQFVQSKPNVSPRIRPRFYMGWSVFVIVGHQIQWSARRNGGERSVWNHEHVVEKGNPLLRRHTGNWLFCVCLECPGSDQSEWWEHGASHWSTGCWKVSEQGMRGGGKKLTIWLNRASRLNDEQRIVYNAIRASGGDGIWTKDLKKKTNLHTIVLNRTLKTLEQKQEIKSVKHVKVKQQRDGLICHGQSNHRLFFPRSILLARYTCYSTRHHRAKWQGVHGIQIKNWIPTLSTV